MFMLDEEAAIKVLLGIIIVLIFVLCFGAFLLVDTCESQSIMCPYCQRIYKIKFATEVGRGTVPPATSIVPIIRK